MYDLVRVRFIYSVCRDEWAASPGLTPPPRSATHHTHPLPQATDQRPGWRRHLMAQVKLKWFFNGGGWTSEGNGDGGFHAIWGVVLTRLRNNLKLNDFVWYICVPRAHCNP